MTIRLLHGDCREVLPTLEADRFDACITDPPYHLTAVSRGSHARTNNPDSPHGRHRIGDKGFMGKLWDGGDVAFRPETWAEVLRVMKPGAWLVAFGGTRTYHRLVCAIEDAGFEVRDMLAWLYGSGFPKGTDKAKTPAAWAGWNTALKPAIEPICLARKPMQGTLAANLERWGTGAIWIDGCRVDLDGEVIEATGKGALPTRHDEHQARAAHPIAPRPESLGRWPANVLHDGSDEVLQAFPIAPGQQADVSDTAPSPKTSNVYGRMRREGEASATSANVGAVGFRMKPGARRLDTGSAARFFWSPKASRADRNEGCDGLPLRAGGMVSNTSGQHITRRDGGAPQPAANHHPTVKPTDLMRYLCRLVTPPGGVVLDPFMGSGSTLKAAELEGFAGIGIELEREYLDIAQRRIGADAPLLTTVEAA